MLRFRINENYTKRHRSRRTLRNFGLFGGLTLLALSIFTLRCNRMAGSGLILAALVVILLAELRPDALIGLHRFWFGATFLLGAVLTPLMLGALYFIVVTPIGLLRRAFGRRELDLRFRTRDTSYWQKRLPSDTKADYEKQF